MKETTTDSNKKMTVARHGISDSRDMSNKMKSCYFRSSQCGTVVRNLTSVTRVAVEVWVHALAGHSALKDVALPQQ